MSSSSLVAMGSDNPKGAVAKVSFAAKAGRFGGIGAAFLVLYVCLSTSPRTTPTVDAIDNTRVGGAALRRGGEGRGALAARYGGNTVGVDGGKTSGDVSAKSGGDHVTAQALPKLSASSTMTTTASTGASIAPAKGLYALRAVDVDGVDTSLSFLQGKITLVVNVASE